MDLRHVRREIGRELANDFFEDVFERDDALNVAVLVDDQRDTAFLLLEVEQLRVQRRALAGRNTVRASAAAGRSS